jgi:hypothetical protein
LDRQWSNSITYRTVEISGEKMGVVYLNNGKDFMFIPEQEDKRKAGIFKEMKKINMETNGYGPEKLGRLEARIPREVEYNYLMSKGIMPENHINYMKNEKHYQAFLSEFSVFRMVNNV